MKGSSAGDKTVLFIFKTRKLINEWRRFVRSFVDGNAHQSKSIIETFLSALKEILNVLRTIKLWTVINATKDRFTRSMLLKSNQDTDFAQSFANKSATAATTKPQEEKYYSESLLKFIPATNTKVHRMIIIKLKKTEYTASLLYKFILVTKTTVHRMKIIKLAKVPQIITLCLDAVWLKQPCGSHFAGFCYSLWSLHIHKLINDVGELCFAGIQNNNKPIKG